MGSRYAVIIGETKAGTSSLYHYLADHPEVIPTVQKQTDFFLDEKLLGQLEVSKSKYSDAVEVEYLKRFSPDNEGAGIVWLDVSPDYMYSQSAIEYLSKFLMGKDYLLIVTLRNPIDRLVSWFQFGKQLGLLEKDLDFSQYLAMQDKDASNAALKALETGKFMNYLQPLNSQFDDNKVKYYRFDMLKSAPLVFMKRMAKDMKISSEFYETYEFHQHNKTQEVRSARVQKLYVSIQRVVYKAINNNHIVNSLLMPVLSRFGKAFRRVNAVEKSSIQISNTELKYLEDFYFKELAYLEHSKFNNGHGKHEL